MKWGEISLIWILLALLVGVVFGFAVFGELQYYFPATFWLSIATACFSGIGAILGQLKLWYEVRKLVSDGEKAKDEIRKLQLEVRKLEREEEAAEREKNSVIVSPTAEHIEKYGQSEAERTVSKRFRTDSRDQVKPGRFVADSHEEEL
jgi:hypothetical protein